MGSTIGPLAVDCSAEEARSASTLVSTKQFATAARDLHLRMRPLCTRLVRRLVLAGLLDELLRVGSWPTTRPGSRRPPELPPAAAIAEIPLGPWGTEIRALPASWRFGAA